ncbi:GNAT family N-acetyltransferase [Planococcus sp. SSTMD024]|uniref:GNAT family N-acetyltransferase n=1 Tax=Planococcus sp. SSTMD024 TaxID=3242163 RepID=UPI00351DBE35
MANEKFEARSETERLIVRPLQIGDYAEWLKGFNGRSPSKHAYDPGRLDMEECTEPWFSELVEKHQQLAKGDIAHVFGVFQKEDGRHVGMVDFSTLARQEFQWGRIGYTIHNQYWQQGYGKEAVTEALNIAFTQLGFHRIEAHINLDNKASVRLAERAGMKFECVREAFLYEGGEWVDHLIYSLNHK